MPSLGPAFRPRPRLPSLGRRFGSLIVALCFVYLVYGPSQGIDHRIQVLRGTSRGLLQVPKEPEPEPEKPEPKKPEPKEPEKTEPKEPEKNEPKELEAEKSEPEAGKSEPEAEKSEPEAGKSEHEAEKSEPQKPKPKKPEAEEDNVVASSTQKPKEPPKEKIKNATKSKTKTTTSTITVKPTVEAKKPTEKGASSTVAPSLPIPTKKIITSTEKSKTTTTPNTTEESIAKTEMESDCTPPAYHEFPPDAFGQYARSRGAIIIHILVVMYMFYAVAVVCDDYFISSLEECCTRLNLSDDVAGATFMAAGSSAPELFTAILGVLIAKGDVGTGTIVGSAVFNVLFVIGLCGIFSGRVVTLNWWPLFRDSIYYAFTVILLIIIIYDSEVSWYESLIMLIFYVIYIIIMKFNNAIHHGVSKFFHIQEDEAPSAMGILNQNSENKSYSSYVAFNNEIDDHAQTPVTSQVPLPVDENIRLSTRRLTLYEASQMMMMTRYFPPLTRFRAAGRLIICEQQRLRQQRTSKLLSQSSVDPADILRHRGRSMSVAMTTDDTWRRVPSCEEGIWMVIKWAIQFPVLITLHYTIPDCKKSQFRKWFLLTFFMSILWTAIFSYVMVWMVVLIGFTMGIPDSIMGITFLAAGTSVPDAFASLVVARQGQGDMAVSNSIGSNVFDILVGLALPWFIQTAMVEPGSLSTINSRGMVYAVVLLFLTIIITIAGVHFSGWQLTPKLGIILIIIYFIFLTASCMLEFNVLGYVNPPMCPE